MSSSKVPACGPLATAEQRREREVRGGGCTATRSEDARCLLCDLTSRDQHPVLGDDGTVSVDGIADMLIRLDIPEEPHQISVYVG